MDDEFVRLQVQWEKTGDPRYVWRTIATCAVEDVSMPMFARKYLISVAKGIEDIKGDIGRGLRDILQFSKKPGRRRTVELDLNDEKFVVDFMRQILNGVSAGKARENAASASGMGADDKELTRRLKSFFGLKTLPAKIEQRRWKLIVATWLLNHPHYVERYPNLPTIFDFRPGK